MRQSVIVKQNNGGTQNSAPFVLNCTPQLLQRFTINNRVYCCALGQKSTKRIPCVSQNTVHMIFLVEKVCLNFFPFRRASMLPVQGLLFLLRCVMGHPCLVSCHNMAQHAVSFLVIVYQKCQSTCNTLFLCSSVTILGTHLAHTFR